MKTKESEGLRPDWIYKRGDVYWADLNPFFGSEQGGTRPVLVLQNDAGNFFSPTLIVAPMSSQVDKRTDLPTHIVLEQVRGLDGPSLIMLEQLKTIDKRRVRSYAGKLTKEQMAEVEAALTGTLGIYITEAVEAP
ncbi:MAG: type II toxin-antitoxin system PemK/MazF family toxin [Lachnospiraceae bacterium]|jgi:mRNA interferase MazF|nr:type II toxin-antitoxin system PemK/MazF family toxin [Lachnospiraceae bacterium]